MGGVGVLSLSKITAIGVDVGGTKIAAGLVDQRGQILIREKAALSKGKRDGLLPAEQIGSMVGRLNSAARERGLSVVGCGVAVPAFVDRATGDVLWAPNIEGWRNFPLGQFLRELTGLPVILDHDGPAAILGEQWVGAARGSSDAVFLIVGTGIGAGFILNGQVYRGASGLVGGVGWTCLESGAIEEPFFKAGGFLETVAAGPGIARRFREEESLAGGEEDETWASSAGRVEVTAEEVFAFASEGNLRARRVVTEAARYLGMAVANLISALNPEVIILGGGVGCHLGPYLEEIYQVIKETTQPQALEVVRVVTAVLGDDGGVIGSARGFLDA